MDYLKSYISTSLDKEQTEDFLEEYDCCMMNITVASGSKALPVYVISSTEREKEVLLDRNGYMVVNNTDYVGEMKTYFCTYFAREPKEVKSRSQLEEKGLKLAKENIPKRIAVFLKERNKKPTTKRITKVYERIAKKPATEDVINQVRRPMK